MIDDNELTEHLRKTTEFDMSLKKAKQKLKRFLEYDLEITTLIKVCRYSKVMMEGNCQK